MPSNSSRIYSTFSFKHKVKEADELTPAPSNHLPWTVRRSGSGSSGSANTEIVRTSKIDTSIKRKNLDALFK